MHNDRRSSAPLNEPPRLACATGTARHGHIAVARHCCRHGHIAVARHCCCQALLPCCKVAEGQRLVAGGALRNELIVRHIVDKQLRTFDRLTRFCASEAGQAAIASAADSIVEARRHPTHPQHWQLSKGNPWLDLL